ncbi:MAG: 5'-methylthioadenosine/adenosylhomocysteine nucleosidase [Coriobacteriales bacterium]|jgi:adenosylhomocysteine nucleosidase
MKSSSKRRIATSAAMAIALVLALALAGCAGGESAQDEDMTGIIGAMESEVTTIKGEMSDTKVTTVSGMEFTEGTIDGNKAVVVQCGMGKVNAGICAQTLINEFGADRVIKTGVAGTLTDELSINDFVVSTDAVQHDYDVSPIGFKKGEIPYTGLVSFPADETMRAQAVEAVKQAAPESKVLEGRVCTGDQFVNTQEQIDTITSDFGGLCAEMEGGAIAQVCYLNETPYVIIRAISDDSDGMSFEEFQAEAAQECANATLTMVAAL